MNDLATASGVVLAVVTGVLVPFWGTVRPIRRMRMRAGAVLAAAGPALAVSGALAWQAPALHGLAWLAASALAAVAAVLGGGPVASATLRLADPGKRDRPGPADPDVLHGGAWVGALERIGVAASLLAGWPEGVALAMAIKGLGRYAELRTPAAAERFIIGTFASVLWACGAAGVGLALRG